MKALSGTGGSRGVAVGRAFVVAMEEPEIPEVDDAVKAFSDAASKAAGQLDELAAAADGAGLGDAGDILRAQSLMAQDPMLASEVETRVNGGAPLGEAIDSAAGGVKQALLDSGSEYLAARAADIDEIVRRIRFALAGVQLRSLSAITEPGIVIARELTAADTATMDPASVLGFVTEEGGPTGHVAVIARALGIPAVVGASGATEQIDDGLLVAIDGGSGEIVVDPDEAAQKDFAQRRSDIEAALSGAAAFKGKSIAVAGRSMTIAANVGGRDDVAAASDHAADGVGLFRTEFLFLDAHDPPAEDDQVAVYREALEAFDHPVVIRTFDIGGDKPAPYLDLPAEENPFLGVRGMRLYADYRELALNQARALLRAAPAGELWVMAPMVATVGDAIAFRSLFDEARQTLAEAGAAFGDVRLGVMVEVPSAALNARSMAQHVDFFSIGTNDLTQYAMAADRTLGRLAGYNDAAEPGVLALCAQTAAAGNSAGISVSVCGEAAADPVLAVLYAAMGMDKLSVAPTSVNLIKQTLSALDPSGLDGLLRQALAAPTAAEVRQVVGSALGA